MQDRFFAVASRGFYPEVAVYRNDYPRPDLQVCYTPWDASDADVTVERLGYRPVTGAEWVQYDFGMALEVEPTL